MKNKILLTAMVLGSMLSMVGCKDGSILDKSTTIDLNKYISIEVSGYNSKGEAEVSFDYDAYAEDYKDKIEVKVEEGKDNNLELNLELNMGEKPYEALRGNCFSYDVDKESELSNGDVITISWDCDEKSAKNYFDCNLKYSDIEYKVEGLEELESFNPFDYVEVDITGVSPSASVTVTPDLDKKEMQYISFTVDKKDGLSNGDTVVVTANVDDVDEFAKNFNSLPDPVSKEFTVEGLGSYVTSVSEIDEAGLDAMKKQAEDVYKAHWVELEGNLDGLHNLTYIGNYFLSAKKSGVYKDENYIYMVYKVDASYEGVSYPHYMYIRFNNIAVDEAGKCEVDLSKYEETSNEYYVIDNGFFDRVWYYGYGTLDDLYNDCVVKKIDKYTYENNITEGE